MESAHHTVMTLHPASLSSLREKSSKIGRRLGPCCSALFRLPLCIKDFTRLCEDFVRVGSGATMFSIPIETLLSLLRRGDNLKMEELDPIFPHAFAHHHILAGLTAYYIVEGLLKLLCRHYKPDFYARLKSNDRFLPFFGFCMGWIITLLSTPVCFHAFLTEKYALSTY